jgi:hypothetical protein
VQRRDIPRVKKDLSVKREQQIPSAKKSGVFILTCNLDVGQNRNDKNNLVFERIETRSVTRLEAKPPRQILDLQPVQPRFEFAGFKIAQIDPDPCVIPS